MAEGVMMSVVNSLTDSYESFVSIFPNALGIQVFMFGILIAIVSIFIWHFYKSLSQKNLISLNLRQYNRASHPGLSKFLAIIFYFIEYLLIMPILILVWFTALSIILLLVSEHESISNVLVLTAAVVIAVRILAYYSREIAQDLGKLFPFITLSVFLLSPGEFDSKSVIPQILEIPQLLSSILSFLLIIVAIEIALRLFYTIFDYWESEDEAVSAPDIKEKEEQRQRK